MFWEKKPLNSVLGGSGPVSELVSQVWTVAITTHPRIKSFQPGSITVGTGSLIRAIKSNLTSRDTPYLAIFRDVLETTEIINSYTFLPHIVADFTDTLLDHERLEEYLSGPRIELDVLGQGLDSLFVYKTYTMFRGGTVHAEFKDHSEQRQALSTLLVAFSKFLKNGILREDDIEALHDWVDSRFDVPELFGKMRSYIHGIQTLTSLNTVCYSVDSFVDSLEYLHDRFDNVPLRHNQDVINVFDLPSDVQRSILSDVTNLTTIFSFGTLKPLSKTSLHIFSDRDRKYFFKTCDPIVESYYVCMELYVDYIISRVLEECVPVCRNFALTLCCVADAKVNVDSIYRARPTIPRLMISPLIKGGTMYAILKSNKISDEVLVDCLMEVFGALQDAYDTCQLTHYDLHTGNVMLEQCEPYSWQWRQYMSRSLKEVRPVVIDFGRSRVVFEDRVLCRPWSPVNQNYIGVQPDRAYPAHDIFRLLQSCYQLRQIGLIGAVLENLFEMSTRELEYSFGAGMYSMPYREEYARIEYKDALEALMALAHK